MINSIKIPVPQKMPGTKKGIYSTGHINACDNKVRFSPYDTELIDKAAIICSKSTPGKKISRAAFIRWCAVYSALEILKKNIKKELPEDYLF